MRDLNFLTDHDVQLLKDLLQERRGRRQNTAQRPYYPEDDAKAPDVYVAKTTSAIPALADHGTTGTGTGTGVEPGQGTADIYRADLNDYMERRLHAMGPDLPVFNLSGSNVSSGTWCLVERDKWGVWYVVQPPTTTGSGGSSIEDTWVLPSEQDVSPSSSYAPGVVLTLAGEGVFLITGAVSIRNKNFSGTSVVSHCAIGAGGSTTLYASRGFIGGGQNMVLNPSGSIYRSPVLIPINAVATTNSSGGEITLVVTVGSGDNVIVETYDTQLTATKL